MTWLWITLLTLLAALILYHVCLKSFDWPNLWWRWKAEPGHTINVLNSSHLPPSGEMTITRADGYSENIVVIHNDRVSNTLTVKAIGQDNMDAVMPTINKSDELVALKDAWEILDSQWDTPAPPSDWSTL